MMGLNEKERQGLRCLRDCGCIIVQDTADARAKYAGVGRRGLARWQWHGAGVLRVTYVFAAPKSHLNKPHRHWQGWTEDETNRVSFLVSEGWSFAAIAKDLGRTKNSVIGRWGRICADVGKEAA